MAEVLDNVKAVAVANHAHSDHVIGWVEQVRAMWGGEHEMFVSVLGVVIERDVFSLLIELELSCRCQTNGEGGLAVKLM